MLFVIGLGNPGSQYDGTRHNVGFDVVDALADSLKMRFKPGKGDYLEALGLYQAKEIGLAKPLTYMNNSGSAVMEIQGRYGISVDQLLIICDDFWLPLGSLRLRTKGSDGGHNGLYSIIYHLQSDLFPRLRCGIASESIPKDKSLMADFVLEPFTASERRVTEKMVTRAKEACLCILTEDLEQAMNLYNTKPDR